jgi:CelD/BcsL family acetyltransferase involved in cellulose biosynthesis
VLVSADTSPRMVVSKLTLDGRTAAIEAGFCHHGAYHLYLGAFAPEFAKLGPGNVLTEKVLEWCIANGIKRYDMLAPRSRNKREWQSNEVAIVDFALPATLRGRLYAALVMKRLAPALRDAFYALPPRARSFIASMTLRM